MAANLTFELFSTDMAASLARAGVGLYARQCLNSAIGGSVRALQHEAVVCVCVGVAHAQVNDCLIGGWLLAATAG